MTPEAYRQAAIAELRRADNGGRAEASLHIARAQVYALLALSATNVQWIGGAA